jgi:hypothetical protein
MDLTRAVTASPARQSRSRARHLRPPGGRQSAGSRSSSSETLEEFAGGATSMVDTVRLAGNVVRTTLWYCAELVPTCKFTTELLDKLCLLAEETADYCEWVESRSCEL